MTTLLVLAMHGVPPRDFPPAELMEFMGLHARLEHAPAGAIPPAVAQRYAALEDKLRRWPRHAANDPFFVASQELAAQLAQASGLKVLVGFNEFCAPSLDETFAQAVTQGAQRVVVITPMMTRGGEHAEADIPAAIARAQAQFPGVAFRYAWPFPPEEIAALLAAQVKRALGE